jgi:hypothetical protein
MIFYQVVDQLFGYGHAGIGRFRHTGVTHTKGHDFVIRSGDDRHQSVIALFFHGDGIYHGGALVNRQSGFNGLGIRAVNTTGCVDSLLDGCYKPF